jgi:fatty acid desaturase
MDHKAIVSKLGKQQRLHLTALSDGPGRFKLAQHIVLITLCGWLIAIGVPGWPVVMLAQGILLVFLFTLLHEAAHRTPFKTVWINKAVSWMCGLVLFLPPEWFRYFHFAHHRFTQDPDNDPELASPKPETLWQYIVHVSGMPVWRSQIGAMVKNAIWLNHDAFVPERGRVKLLREARIMCAVYAVLLAVSLAAGSALLIWIWLLPMLVGQPFLRLYLLAEHGRCALVANMLENSRTTFTNSIVRWLAWNMPYHTEHHVYPAVPYHKLPELHRLTRDHLRVTEDGYARFNAGYVRGMKG